MELKKNKKKKLLLMKAKLEEKIKKRKELPVKTLPSVPLP